MNRAWVATEAIVTSSIPAQFGVCFIANSIMLTAVIEYLDSKISIYCYRCYRTALLETKCKVPLGTLH